MCDVLLLQPAGAFLRQAQKFQPSVLADPIAIVGSCTDIDVALRLRPECDGDDAMTHDSVAYQMGQSQLDEHVDFLTAIRRGLDELVADASDDESDDESDEEGEYYQASKENMYYSPEQKYSCGFLQDDALDLSDTSTSSSSLFTAWAQQEFDDDDDDDDDNDDDDTNELIFQLEL
ncbi:unnamed protein product [Peronospora effusa]|uniref:Uncharacterized protein n=1 Tax=Peronospora effusa TaxID=542832 RepID=A0A3M6VA22_9STRA|nr:hypothetical protein DD238_007446 [Peronospora effusa]RQM10053.1 hypothetical protein DD237_004372 [Peronospora effusa]CAI5707426.1 unnamed protein product [Peronospora effusa]